MKIFRQLHLDPLEFRASARIQFRGFQQGVPYGNGNITLGNLNFIGGQDFDLSTSDVATAITLRDAIVNSQSDFWAEVDMDTANVFIYYKNLGETGNNYPILSTFDPNIVTVFYNTHLSGGKDVYYSKIYDFSEIQCPKELKFTLHLGYINGGDVSSQVKVVVEQCIDAGDYLPKVTWIEVPEQFKIVGFDKNNNLKNNLQKLILKKENLIGNKFRYKITQIGTNVNCGLSLNALAQ